MSPLRLSGSISGYSEIEAPAIAGSETFTLPGTGGTLDRLNRAGNVLQIIEASTTTGTATTTIIPYDDTIPQNTEGAEIMTASITPTSASSKLLILANLPVITANAAAVQTAALFQDSTANALAVASATPSANNLLQNITLSHYMTAGTTSSTTFKIRYGPASGSGYVNRINGGASIFGSIPAARIVIMEIAP